MLARPLALALVLPLVAGCLRVRGTPGEPIVTAVVLEGVTAFDPDAIKGRLATQEPSSGEGPLGFLTRVGYRLDPDALAVDRRRVEAWYRVRGYYGARVEDVKVEPDGAGRAKVILRIHEGAPVRVRGIALEGLDAAPEARAAIRNLPLHEGDVFTDAAYDAARAQIETALKTTGWANGEVVQSAHVLPDVLAADVTYDVRPGPRYRFGPIFVAGSATVPRQRIRDQAAVEIHAGDWFDETKLARAQSRVFDLGVFSGVRVTPGAPDPARGIVPIVVAVREAPFRTIRAGPGLAVEATRWEVRGLGAWTNRNFHGDLRRVDVELRAGYAWIPTIFTRTKEGFVGNLLLGYSQPAVIAQVADIAARIELERGIEPAYEFWSQRLRLGTPLRIAPRWTLIPSYNVEVYELSSAPTEAIGPLSGGAPVRPLLENCTASVCLVSYVEERLAWDGRDDPVNTRRGMYVSLAVQEGFPLAKYGYRYLRFLPELRGFVPLGPRLVVAARARVGALVPLHERGEPPAPVRFFAGGPLSMRGYYTGRLAPMVVQSNQWVPVGGNGLADGSLELRYGLARGWGTALFLDAGNVSIPSGVPNQYLDALRHLQYAAGVGVRYGTPFGPLRLDLGVRLPTDYAPHVAFFHRFPTVPPYRVDEYGLHREPILAVQFTIGEAF